LVSADEVGESDEVDAAACLDRLDAEGDREVRLAGAGRAEQMDHLVAVDEVELGERQDAVAVERRLEGEVEAGERLDGRKPRHHQGGLDAAALAQRQLLGEQRLDRLEWAYLAALELADGGVDHLERPRHAEADQGVPDAVEHRAGRIGAGRHAGCSAPASRRAMAS
jgi:hypothetical protein